MALQPQTEPVQVPPDAMADPVNQEKVELGKAFATQLLKGIKQIGMYRHNDSKFAEFLGPAQRALSDFTDKHGSLSLKIEAQNFNLLGQSLFAEESAMPYKFYKDGVRQLIFRPGLPVEELVKFTLIATSDP